MLKGSLPMKCLGSVAQMPGTVCLHLRAWVKVGRVSRSPRYLRSLRGNQGWEWRIEMLSPAPKPLALLLPIRNRCSWHEPSHVYQRASFMIYHAEFSGLSPYLTLLGLQWPFVRQLGTCYYGLPAGRSSRLELCSSA